MPEIQLDKILQRQCGVPRTFPSSDRATTFTEVGRHDKINRESYRLTFPSVCDCWHRIPKEKYNTDKNHDHCTAIAAGKLTNYWNYENKVYFPNTQNRDLMTAARLWHFLHKSNET